MRSRFHIAAVTLVVVVAGALVAWRWPGRRPSLAAPAGGRPAPESALGVAARVAPGVSAGVGGAGEAGGTRTATTPPPSPEAGEEAFELEAPFRAFAEWLAIQEAGFPAGGGERLAEGIALARARREALRRLIPRDPERALALAVPGSVRQRLAPALVAELEERVAARGRWEVRCASGGPGSGPGGVGSSYERTFEADGRSYIAHVYGRRGRQQTAPDLVLHGVAVDDVLAVHEDPARLLDAGEAAAAVASGRAEAGAPCVLTGVATEAAAGAVWVQYAGQLLPLAGPGLVDDLNARLAEVEPGFRAPTEPPAYEDASRGLKRVLYMRVRFPDDVREPISEAEAAEVMRLANEFFLSASYNTLSLLTTVGPLVMLPQPKLYYAAKGAGALLRDAREATREAGVAPGGGALARGRWGAGRGFRGAGLGPGGGTGAWLQSSGLGVVCHELGHNLGLAHANFWNTVRPEPPDDPQGLPFDPDALVGVDTVLGPGDDVEYGDPFDVMGSGGEARAHFTALHKRLLGWLPDGALQTVTTNGIYRVHAHDGGLLGAGLHHLLRVRKDAERWYWIDARSRWPDNPWLAQGVELHWNNWHQAIATCQLLDTTPGSRPGKTDAALTLGRTFVDPAAELFLTPVRRGDTELGGVRVPFYDVAVFFGPFPGNASPELELSASALEVAPGEAVTLNASAVDTDGDPLAYAWDLGDGMPGPEGAVVTHAWAAPGDRVVRCEVSDLRGGLAAKHLVVRVGRPGTLRVSGTVVDQAGRPLAGVRVHNGQAGTNGPYADDYRWGYTDSDGRYTLSGLRAGSYGIGAVLGGYVARPLNFSRPLVLNQFTGVGVDFIATRLPAVSVTRVADGDEAQGRPASFRLSRSGPTNEALRVYFRVSGSATETEDYTPWPAVETQTNVIPTVLTPVRQTIPLGYADLGPGVGSTNLAFPVVSDALAEGDETLVLTLTYPVTRTVITETATNVFDIPGWEIQSDNGQDTWFQTRPYYQLDARDEATVRIRDASAPAETTVSVFPLGLSVSENTGDSASFLVLRMGRAPAEALRVPLRVTGTATPGDDFEAPPGFVLLPAEALSVRVTLPVLDDLFVEGNEWITLNVGPGEGYRVGLGAATIPIVDNDLPLVAVVATDPVVSEAGGTARVTFQRTGDLERPLEVDYLLGGTATVGEDYEPLSGRVVLAVGASSASITLTARDDAQLEGDETIEIQLGDSPVYNVLQPARAVLLLQDDEFPVVTVEAVDDEAMEGGDEGAFLFRRTGPTADSLVVRYRFGGSAAHQADFVASGDRIEIGPGQRQAVLTVTPIDDAYREDPETIAIELVEDPAYSLGTPARAAIRLEDNGDAEPAVGFAVLASRGPESRTDPELVVRISGNPDEGEERAVTVAWEVLGGLATPGQDYVLTNGTTTFAWAPPDGDQPFTNRVAFIPLQVLDDAVPEGDENVVVRLRIAPTEIPSEDPEQPPAQFVNGRLDVYAVHTYTILDDDQAEISVRAARAETAEGSGVPAEFTVARSGRTNAAQTVVLYVSGLAAPGSDYLPLPSFVTLAPGQVATNLVVQAIDDPVAEYREDVVLTLVSAPGARLPAATRHATVVIDDNDGTVEFAAARWQVSEDQGVARLEVRRTGDTRTEAAAVFEVLPGTATPVTVTDDVETGDYYGTNGVVRFAPGEVLQTLEIRLRDDEEPEPPETFGLRLSRGSDLFPLGGQNVATVTVVDNDAILSTGTNLVYGIETDPEAVIDLERSGPVDGGLTARFATEDLTASAGEDYEATAGSVTFAPGERTAQIRVPLRNDFALEGDEVFLIRLMSSDGGLLGEVPVTIVDDDCALEFAADTAEVDEDAGVAELVVRRVGSPLKPVAVHWTALSGTAREGEDFAAGGGRLDFLGNRFEVVTNGTGGVVFRFGETNQVIYVPILNDAEGERDETFEVILANAEAGSPSLTIPFVRLGNVTNATVTIRDNEAPGRVDDRFQPGLGADAPVRTLALQADGKVLVGGDFTTFDGVVLPRFARLHADGFVDRSFNPGRGFDGSVLAAAEVAEGRVFVGGTFSTVDGADQPFLARLEPDGTRAGGFQPACDGPVRALRGRNPVFVGGDFARVNGEVRPAVARLTPGGELDPAFRAEPGVPASVRALALTGDGGVVVGGVFANWAGSGARFLVGLTAEGAPDPSFGAAWSPNGPVHALVRAGDGSLWVGGEFTDLGGLPRAGLARLLPGGGVDASFDPGPAANAAVLAAGVQNRGFAVFAGAFDQFAGQPAGRFVRVGPDGALDTTFFRGTGANDTIRALAVQADGAFLIGGDFTEVNARPRRRLARIHADEKFVEGFVEWISPVFTVNEADAEAVVGVRRTGAAKDAARVTYAAIGATAEPGLDFAPVTGELVFAPGETNRTLRIPIQDDALAEGSETVALALTNPEGVELGRQATATLVIVDDEPALAFDLVAVDVAEAAGAVRLVLRRSGPVEGVAQVGFSTEDGTARAGEDYLAAAGTAVFGPGVATTQVTIVVLDDLAIEGPEDFRVRLESPSAGWTVGSQGMVTVTVTDDDRLPTHYTLTIQPGTGGRVVPAGGRFPTNAVALLTALPEPGFEFARWEGSVVSADNPLTLVMDRNHVLAARFRSRAYLEDFESGGFDRLPWRMSGDAPWRITRETASGGVHSAQAGTVADSGRSILALEWETPAGGASFDFRTATETAWDFLEFRVNGELRERWSGVNGWQTYAFNVPAGLNRLEWQYVRDRTFGGALDAVWIDNLDLPDDVAPAAAPRLVPVRDAGGCVVRVEGTPDRLHVLEVSTDLRTWTVVGARVSPDGPFLLADPGCDGGARFYRVRVE